MQPEKMDASCATAVQTGEASFPCEVDEKFPVGSVVRLVGLRKEEFNHHVGQVVVAEKDGRVGVALHGSIWPSKSAESRRSRGQDPPNPFSLKLINLRKAKLPSFTKALSRNGTSVSSAATDAAGYAAVSSAAVGAATTGGYPSSVASSTPLAPATAPALGGVGPVASSTQQGLLTIDSIPGWALLRLLGESGWGLNDFVAQQVLGQLYVPEVSPEELKVSGCSSDRGDYPLDVVLNDDESEWWISEGGSCPGGIGEEYLEFTLGPALRRVSYVALKIPPLPYGPLSVREFHVLALNPTLSKKDDTMEEDEEMTDSTEKKTDAWKLVSPNPLTTLDRPDLQEFALVPPVETTKVRLVFTRAAAAGGFRGADCIGLFQVALA
eukprot:TRINITY_DN23710_c0_g1_i1.p1 TRINITY_DN23710_c0_g1~~TRINITY_DN23710_c0_g1_i1.p1  ORF type:complete len:381 (-),score=80.65 TRINITY_DN23710_c0_g1_i1:315-1457(-)